jgi:hypothetical protein
MALGIEPSIITDRNVGYWHKTEHAVVTRRCPLQGKADMAHF